MIKIKGRTPSKKNSSIQVVRNGKICHFPSNQYQAWHKDAVVQANAQKINLFAEQEKLGNALHVKIFYPDSRVGDLTNKAESVMDLLVDTGFLDDDNWYQVNLLLLQFGGVDKIDPRAEVQNLKTECPHCGGKLYE